MKKFTFLVLMFAASLGYSQLALPLDFESGTLTYTFNDFNGGQATVISNPQSSGINTSATVAQMIKSPGEVWGGSYLEMANPIDFTNTRRFNIKVYSPRAGARLLLKIENLSDGSIFFQKEDTVSIANSWEELSFDFRYINLNKQYSKVVLIFDMGVMGDGSGNFTFLFDDIELINDGPYLAQVDLPVTFEDTTVDYSLTDFGGAYSAVVADPAGGSNKVAKSIKSKTAAGWAGTTMSTPLGFANRIPITASETKMHVRVYAPGSGIRVRLKIEDANDNTKSVETEALTTMGNSWETLEFDFSKEAPGTAMLNPGYNFTMASIFFFFDTNGAGAGADTVYYWDDASFGPAPAAGLTELEAMGVSCFPNPVKDFFHIRAAQPIDEVLVFSTMGQQLLIFHEVGLQQSLDLSSLAAGLYIIRLRVGERTESLSVMKD